MTTSIFPRRPNPLLYAAGPALTGSFRVTAQLDRPVRGAALAEAAARAARSFPGFALQPRWQGGQLYLAENPRPFALSPDGSPLPLGGEASHGHLVAFAAEGDRIHADACHFITDGVGFAPFMKAVLWHYFALTEPDPELMAQRELFIPDRPEEAAFAYPFPRQPLPCSPWPRRPCPGEVFAADRLGFDPGGPWVYRLHMGQGELMRETRSSSGSPVSFLMIMLYGALIDMTGGQLPYVVGHVQHQYRAALGDVRSGDSLVCIVPVTFAPTMMRWDTDRLNTALRGQILLGADTDCDLAAVNRIQALDARLAPLPPREKMAAAREHVTASMAGKTFGISYMGRTQWGAMEGRIRDFWAQIGERDNPALLLMEVMAHREHFTVTLIQGGRGDALARALTRRLTDRGVPCTLAGAEPLALSEVLLPPAE